ncbi:hypothetical protein CC78DRAFT_527498 [Lojkania enalia]|uniref:Rhodopsin domain-containing protein n=1 Tax=Lojkania enalia TaxID=147567 RepID=A0A9P4JV11_9PLEO|nr:hypothetical protein CC78DRAFT_527498 [Didymosphaeria enalia]
MDAGPATALDEHRFALITVDDQSGYLWIASILCLIYTLLILVTRLHIKWNLYGADDVAATVATILQLGEVVPLFLAMKNGLGKSEHLLDAEQLSNVGRATFAAQIFLILALATAKGSVAALMLRLFTRDMKVTRMSWILCNAVLALTVAWGIGAIIALSVACSPSSFVRDVGEKCGDQVLRWRIITVVDIVIELLLIILPVLFVWPIQMKAYIKLQVIVAFGFRAPVIGFGAAHMHYVGYYANSDDASKAMIPALVYQQFELFWALLSATIPTLKAFMRSFNSGFGMEIDLDGYGSGYGSNGYYNGTYPLESLKNATAPNGVVTSTPETRARGQKSTGTGPQSAAGSVRGRGASVASERIGTETVNSDGSQEMIIRREVQWTVSHDDAKQ